MRRSLDGTRHSKRRVMLARLIAAAADFFQIFLFPAFIGGALSPVTDLLDLVMAALMVWLLGWHWAFVPTFLVELAPVADLFPTWTAAVLFVTWGRAADETSRTVTPPPVDPSWETGWTTSRTDAQGSPEPPSSEPSSDRRR